MADKRRKFIVFSYDANGVFVDTVAAVDESAAVKAVEKKRPYACIDGIDDLREYVSYLSAQLAKTNQEIAAEWRATG